MPRGRACGLVLTVPGRSRGSKERQLPWLLGTFVETSRSSHCGTTSRVSERASRCPSLGEQSIEPRAVLSRESVRALSMLWADWFSLVGDRPVHRRVLGGVSGFHPPDAKRATKLSQSKMSLEIAKYPQRGGGLTPLEKLGSGGPLHQTTEEPQSVPTLLQTPTRVLL